MTKIFSYKNRTVKIISNIRKGEIGLYIESVNTVLGLRHRIDFPTGESGLYKENDFVFINKDKNG